MVAMRCEFYIQAAKTISHECFPRRKHLDSFKSHGLSFFIVAFLAFSCSLVNNFMLTSLNLTSLSLAIFQSGV